MALDLTLDKTVVDKILEEINDADMVLVGLGEEFDGSFGAEMTEYEAGKSILMKSKDASFMPLWQKMFRQTQDEKILFGLQRLAQVLEDKNYFVVSVSTNSTIQQISWHEGRLVMPCGTDRYVQCSDGCPAHLQRADAKQVEKLSKYLTEWRNRLAESAGMELSEDLGKCPNCKTKLQFNNIYNENYDENGYLPAWQIYTKWLQGTVNRKLVILELGVGMKFPGVIRFPFEKVAYFNQKAKFYRIHKNLYHLTEELSSKGVGIADNAIDWLQNLC